MGIKKFTLTENSTLSQEEKKMIKKAKKNPIVFDEYSPELTDEQDNKFLIRR